MQIKYFTDEFSSRNLKRKFHITSCSMVRELGFFINFLFNHKILLLWWVHPGLPRGDTNLLKLNENEKGTRPRTGESKTLLYNPPLYSSMDFQICNYHLSDMMHYLLPCDDKLSVQVIHRPPPLRYRCVRKFSIYMQLN